MNIEDWMNSIIALQPYSGGNGQGGDPDFGTLLPSVPARVEPDIKIVRGPDGLERVSSHVIYTMQAITVQDRIWLISEGDLTANVSKARFAIGIAKLEDKTGMFSHYEVRV